MVTVVSFCDHQELAHTPGSSNQTCPLEPTHNDIVHKVSARFAARTLSLRVIRTYGIQNSHGFIIRPDVLQRTGPLTDLPGPVLSYLSTNLRGSRCMGAVSVCKVSPRSRYIALINR